MATAASGQRRRAGQDDQIAASAKTTVAATRTPAGKAPGAIHPATVTRPATAASNFTHIATSLTLP